MHSRKTLRTLLTTLALSMTLLSCRTNKHGSLILSGELKQWHKVTLLLEGPEMIESPSTFRDYRLDVTFSNGDQEFLIPGHFAADGNAAQSGSDRGRYWRVYFTPNKPGEWNYSISFRKGGDVSLSLDRDSGLPFEPFDGGMGSFTIAPSDKGPDDFRARGLLRYVGEHYQQFEGDASYWIAIGTGSPENLLGGSDFDTDSKVGEQWISDHIQDWNPGDPTWREGRGKGVIGAVNYMADHRMNTLWLSLMNAYCDAAATSTEAFPWPGKEETVDNLSTFDVSKLDQWQIVMDHAQNRGMALHIVLGEEESEQLWEKVEGLEVGGEQSFAGTRKLYYREIVSRFGYFNALDWTMGEEFGHHYPMSRPQRERAVGKHGGWPPITDSQKTLFTNYLTALDAYGHSRGWEGSPDLVMEDYGPWFGKPQFNRTIIQGTTTKANQYSITLRKASAAAGTPWVINFSEHHIPTVRVDSLTERHFLIFRQSIWGSFLGGGAGKEWYLESEDYYLNSLRPYADIFLWTALARDFMNLYLPFWEMKPTNALLSGNSGYCFSKVNEVYSLYLNNAESFTLDLSETTGEFEILWYDTRKGGDLEHGTLPLIQGGGQRGLGKPPYNSLSDWVVLVRRKGAAYSDNL